MKTNYLNLLTCLILTSLFIFSSCEKEDTTKELIVTGSDTLYHNYPKSIYGKVQFYSNGKRFPCNSKEVILTIDQNGIEKTYSTLTDADGKYYFGFTADFNNKVISIKCESLDNATPLTDKVVIDDYIHNNREYNLLFASNIPEIKLSINDDYFMEGDTISISWDGLHSPYGYKIERCLTQYWSSVDHSWHDDGSWETIGTYYYGNVFNMIGTIERIAGTSGWTYKNKFRYKVSAIKNSDGECFLESDNSIEIQVTQN